MRQHNHHSKRNRGVAAIETALAMLIVLFVALGGIHFSYAMFVRQRLTAAATRAARVCSVAAGRQSSGAVNPTACAQQLGQAELASLRQGASPACGDIQIQASTQNLSGVSILQVNVRCNYQGGPWASYLNNQMMHSGGGTLSFPLNARSSMPLFP